MNFSGLHPIQGKYVILCLVIFNTKLSLIQRIWWSWVQCGCRRGFWYFQNKLNHKLWAVSLPYPEKCFATFKNFMVTSMVRSYEQQIIWATFYSVEVIDF